MMQIRYRTELPALMRSLGLPMAAAEIGVAEGLHAEDLLKNGIETLYLVDVWKTIPGQKGDASQPQEWHDKNYEKVMELGRKYSGSAFSLLPGLSVDLAVNVADESLGLVYLDGDHSFEGVTADLNAWFPKLVKGGIMAGHDFLAPEYGVKKAVEDWVGRMGDKVSKVYLILENKKEDAGFYFFKQ